MIQAQMPRNEVIIQDRVVKRVSSISSDLCSDTVFLFIGVAYSLISQGGNGCISFVHRIL